VEKKVTRIELTRATVDTDDEEEGSSPGMTSAYTRSTIVILPVLEHELARVSAELH